MAKYSLRLQEESLTMDNPEQSWRTRTECPHRPEHFWPYQMASVSLLHQVFILVSWLGEVPSCKADDSFVCVCEREHAQLSRVMLALDFFVFLYL